MPACFLLPDTQYSFITRCDSICFFFPNHLKLLFLNVQFCHKAALMNQMYQNGSKELPQSGFYSLASHRPNMSLLGRLRSILRHHAHQSMRNIGFFQITQLFLRQRQLCSFYRTFHMLSLIHISEPTRRS